MKKIVFLIAMTVAFRAWSSTCPKLEGKYLMDIDGIAEVWEFQKKDCDELTLIQSELPPVTMKMNGQPLETDDGTITVYFDSKNVYIDIRVIPNWITDLIIPESQRSSVTVLTPNENGELLDVVAIFKRNGVETERIPVIGKRISN